MAIDLFCGLGGWAEGFLSEGFDVIGFDIERRPYPGQLVLQDVLTLHGSQFKNATVIVASPPCQAYSYRAMPWKRAKALPPPDNTLFEACFRIQREACEAAGRYIPLVVENVRGAQKWVGRARWNFGSYYLWGDVPALMPRPSRAQKFNPDGTDSKERGLKVGVYSDPRRNGGKGAHLTSQKENLNRLSDGLKVPGIKLREVGFNVAAAQRYREGIKFGGGWWHDSTNNLCRKASSRSDSRKAASAQIAKIPFPLAQHIAQVYKP